MDTRFEHNHPIIGIVPSLLIEKNAHYLRNHYIDAIVNSGGTPLILPLTSEVSVYETLFPTIDGFVLTGGNDIDASRYGQAYEPDVERIRESYPNIQHGISKVTPTREEVECLILSYAYRFDIPVLGICRGMQMMNVYFGGTLYTDLADQFHGSSPLAACHWQDCEYDTPSHFVEIVRASRLGEVLDSDHVITNSMHHQGVRDLAPLLDATAYGPDGLVEALEVRDRSFMVGVQWHPEYFADDKGMGCLFASLVNYAKKTSEKRGIGECGSLKATRNCKECAICPAIPKILSIEK